MSTIKLQVNLHYPLVAIGMNFMKMLVIVTLFTCVLLNIVVGKCSQFSKSGRGALNSA